MNQSLWEVGCLKQADKTLGRSQTVREAACMQNETHMHDAEPSRKITVYIVIETAFDKLKIPFGTTMTYFLYKY